MMASGFTNGYSNGVSTKIDQISAKSASFIKEWQENIRGGFAPFSVVIEKANNDIVTDVDGKEYIDMISQFAVMNFGHVNPKITAAAIEQMQKSQLVNTSYINPLYAQFASRITKKFNYDSIAAMCTGSEAVESAIKLARKWAYIKKGVPPNEAWILTTDRCYHGLTLATMPLSNVVAENFGKHVPNIGPFNPKTGQLIEFGEIDTLEKALEIYGDKVAAFLIEPIQGYSGTRVPPDGYLKAVQSLCQKYNVLFICDEVQTGFGRTGTDLAYQYESGVQPDLVTLGKAVTGGVYPMSIIMGKKHVMDVLDKFEIASTFAAPPVACAAALAVLDILEEEKISERAQYLGKVFAKAIDDANLPYVLEHRNRDRGLFQCLVVDETLKGVTARRIAALCAQRGVLCGAGGNRLRFSPPLTIPEANLLKAVDIIAKAFRDVASMGDFPGSQYIN